MDKRHLILSIILILPFLGLEMSPVSGSWIASSIIWIIFLILLAIYNKQFVKQIRIQNPFILASQRIVRTNIKRGGNLTGEAPPKNPVRARRTLDKLIERGEELSHEMQSRKFNWFQLELWVQRWLDKMGHDVWDVLPQHAAFIMSEQGGLTPDELIQYHNWDKKEATLRITVDRKLARLREIRYRIQDVDRGGSQTE